MAGNAIASGSAVLTADADGLVRGLAQSEQNVKGWGKRVGGSLDSVGKGGAGGGGTGGLLGSLGTGGALIVGLGAAAAGVTVFGAAVKGTLDDMSKMGAMAQAMGLTAEQFTGMAGVAKSVGEDTREFVESLVTMGKLGTDAANGTEQASAAFKALGLSARDFIKLRADEQFFQIFDSLSKINDPLTKTRTLMQAFGEDGGKYLLPLLGKAPAQLREMGLSFAKSSEDIAKATAATSAWKSMSATAGKLWDGIAIAAAPLVEQVARIGEGLLGGLKPVTGFFERAVGNISPFIEFAGRAGAKVGAAVAPVLELLAAGQERVNNMYLLSLEFIGGTAGRIWDRIAARAEPVFAYLETGWEGVKRVAEIAWVGVQTVAVPVVEGIVTWVERAIDAVADWAGMLFEFEGHWPDLGDLVVVVFRSIGTAAAYTWDVVRAGAGAYAFVAGAALKLLAPVVDAMKNTIRDAADLGYRVAKSVRNEKLAGELLTVYETADTFGDKMRKAGDDLDKWGAHAIDTFGDSADEFNWWLDEMLKKKYKLVDLRDFGGGGDFATAMAEAAKGGPPKLSGAILKGGAEAYSLVMKNNLRGTGTRDEPIKQVVKEAKRANDHHKDAGKKLGRIDDKLSDLGVI